MRHSSLSTCFLTSVFHSLPSDAWLLVLDSNVSRSTRTRKTTPSDIFSSPVSAWSWLGQASEDREQELSRGKDEWMRKNVLKHKTYISMVVFCAIMMVCSDALAADFSRDIVRKIQEAYGYVKAICLPAGGLFLLLSMGKIMFQREPQWKQPTIVGFILLLIASFGKIADFFGVSGF